MLRHWFTVIVLSKHGTFLMWKITKMRKICPFFFSQKFCIIPFIVSLEAPVCVACNVVLTVKHILIECADLLEVRKKYFEEKSLYSLFRNVIPEVIFDFLREIGVFHKV